MSRARTEAAARAGRRRRPVAVGLLAAGLLSFGSVRVSVDDGVFRAGRASIPVVHLGTATALDQESTRRVAGAEADHRVTRVAKGVSRLHCGAA